jgi:hypothetical protein
MLAAILWDRSAAIARVSVVGLAAILTWLTWAHWGSFQVDCGRELYVPLQVLRGKLLYRDIWYSYGPLEPYVAAGLFRAFGTRFSTLYVFGLATLIAGGLLILEIGLMLEQKAAGVTAAIAFVLQGFAPDIFNLIFPYAYAATLGLVLGLLCLHFSVKHALGRGGHNLMFAGLAAGLALLCKQEIGIACYLMLAMVLATEGLMQRSLRTSLYGVAACSPGIVLCAVIYGWFFWTLGVNFVIGNWVGPHWYFVRTFAAAQYAASGLPPGLTRVALLILNAAVAIVAWFCIARLGAGFQPSNRQLGLIAALLIAALIALRDFGPHILHLVLVALAFPPGMFFIGAVFLVGSLCVLRRNTFDRRLWAEAILGTFAMALAARVFAHVQPYDYSIYYDAPLLLVFTIVIGTCASKATASLPAKSSRKLANCLFAVEVLILFSVLAPASSVRTAKFDTAWGELYLEPAEATVAREITDFVATQKRIGNSVVLLPELPMVYALTGTEAPSRLYTVQPGFLPPDWEPTYVSQLRRVDPKYIVLTNRNTSEYGVPYFGIDYDETVYRWIELNYHIIRAFGNFRRDGSDVLAALLYQRNSDRQPGSESSVAAFGMSERSSAGRDPEPFQGACVVNLCN